MLNHDDNNVIDAFIPTFIMWILCFCKLFLIIGYSLYNPQYYTNNLIFIEQDPSLSYYGNLNDNGILYGFLMICTMSILMISYWFYKIYDTTHNENFKHGYLIMLLMGFIWCLFESALIDTIFIILYKSPIPSFFFSCNYHGYADAVKSGNFTEYYSLTRFGNFGNVLNCKNYNNTNSLILVSSYIQNMQIFSFITYSNLILLMFKNRSVKIYCLGLVSSCVSYSLAMYILFNRINNRMISPSDGWINSIFGCVIGYTAYLVNKYSFKNKFPKGIFEKLPTNINNLEPLLVNQG